MDITRTRALGNAAYADEEAYDAAATPGSESLPREGEMKDVETAYSTTYLLISWI